MGPEQVQVRSAGRVLRISGPGLGDIAPRLLAALDGSSSVEEISGRLSLDARIVGQVVGRLHADGVVVEAADWEGDEGRLANGGTTEFFAELGQPPRHIGPALSSARVAIIGLGSVGRIAARHLAAAGVGSLILADDKLVTLADGAALGEPARVGMQRVAVAAEECRTSRGVAQAVEIAATPADNAAAAWDDLLGGIDLALVEVDPSGARAELVNMACLSRAVPFLVHEVTTVEAAIGPAVSPFRSACYECALRRRMAHLQHHDEHLAYRAALRRGELLERHPALLPGCAAIAGGLLSVEALRLVCKTGDAATAGGVLVVDFRSLEVRREEVLAAPGCSACGSGQGEIRLSDPVEA